MLFPAPIASSADLAANAVAATPVVAQPPSSPPESSPSESAPPKSNAPAIDLRVLHVVNGEHFSGAERVQSHLGRCLPGFGVAADFACVKPGKFAAMLAQPDRGWGIGHDATMFNRLDVRAAGRIRDLIQQNRYDLLHAHTPRTAMVTALASRMTGIPWIYHVHSPASRDSSRAMINRVNSWIERQSLRSCAHIISVSESLRMDCILRAAVEEKITVVHNGVPAIRPPRAIEPTVGGRWTIAMIALMRPRKGLEVALEALAIIRRRGHDVVLRVIGPFETSQYEADIQLRIDALEIRDWVEQLGFTANIPEALAQADAMVLPSLFGEGLPMVVLESMAAAVPVIATRVEGTPEAITHGVEGVLAEPRDPDSLADAIESLISGRHDWRRMSESACQTHANKFSDLAMARDTAQVYRNVLK